MAQTRKEQYSDETRRAILRAGRRLFAHRGYRATSVADIVKAARLTTGALYHHFPGKLELFRAIAEDVEQEIMSSVVTAAAASGASDPYQLLLAGIDGMIDAVSTPDVQRIAFIEAPSVLGASAWREIENRYAYGLLHQSLEDLMAVGMICEVPAPILAPIVLGALSEAAGAIASSKDKTAAASAARAAIKHMLDGLVVRQL